MRRQAWILAFLVGLAPSGALVADDTDECAVFEAAIGAMLDEWHEGMTVEEILWMLQATCDAVPVEQYETWSDWMDAHAGAMIEFFLTGGTPLELWLASEPCPQYGVLKNVDAAAGYLLITPFRGPTVYLVDNDGRLVHRWDEPDGLSSASAIYLKESGNLVRTLKVGNAVWPGFAGDGGMIREVDWDNQIVWEFVYNDDGAVSGHPRITHHAIAPMPNGDVLVLAYERFSAEECAEAFASGHLPDGAPCEGQNYEHILQVRPKPGTGSAKVVWQWRLWDHLLNRDQALAGEFHPELWDPRNTAHFNHLEYNQQLGQILISCNQACGEILVIEHTASSKVAAGHSRGKYGCGGDFLYRWGNPQNYGGGAPEDRVFNQQHGARWVLPKDDYGWHLKQDVGDWAEQLGDILVFNNGTAAGESTVVQLTPPLKKNGSYELVGTAYGPDPNDPSLVRIITSADVGESIKSTFLSNPQPLAGGHLLINAGAQGAVWELDRDLNVVWKFVNPAFSYNPGTFGGGPKCPDGYIQAYEYGSVAELRPDPDGPGWLVDGTNWLFRATRYAAAFKGFQGKDLTPGALLTDLESPPDAVCPQP